jgi:hypothetical protein
MVDPGHHGHSLVGQTVDDAQVPKGPLSVEKLTEQPVALLPELPIASGTAQAPQLDMMGDVEMGIVDPYRGSARQYWPLDPAS